MSLTIVIPMAGSGSRFRDAGYEMPKPLIDVRGKPMIAHVIENMPREGAKLVLIARKSDAETYAQAFGQLTAQYGCEFIWVDKLTEGAACTILHAVAQINNDDALLIANSDQWVDADLGVFVADAKARRLDGSILTFEEADRNPKWSYAAIGADGLVTDVREKVAISQHATVGIYWYAKGRYFVEAAAEMIAHNDRCNNEFYVCPAYNYLIGRKLRIGQYGIAKAQMHGLGTPEDLQVFLKRA